MRLRDLLFNGLLADPSYHDEAEFLIAQITWLGVTIGGLLSWDPGALESMPEEDAAARGNALLQIMQARLAMASTWTSAFKG